MKYIKSFEKLKEDPFIAAARKGSSTAIQKMIKDSNININVKSSDGRTALMNATLNNFITVVKTLITAGANINLSDNDGRTALMMASTKSIRDILLNSGANVNKKSSNGKNVAMEDLSYSTRIDKYIEDLNKYLEYGLDLDAEDDSGKNLYDIIQDKKNSKFVDHDRFEFYNKLTEYMNENYPQYKERWEMKNNMSKYNL